MNWQLKLGQKSLILVLVPVVFEIVFVAALFLLLRQAEYEVWRETHSKAVVSETNDIWRLCYDSGVSLFTFAATKQAALGERYAQSERELLAHLRTLELLTNGHPKEEELFRKVDQRAQDARLALRNAQAAITDVSILDITARIRSLRKEFEGVAPKLIAALNELSAYEKHIAETSPKEQERTRALVITFLALGILTSTILAFALARYFNKEAISRISNLVDNTRKLAEHQPLNKLMQGHDEIAQLDKTFHEMAAALEEAAKRKQELMSMVSHDLRSPLMSVEITLGNICTGVYGELPDKLNDPVTKSRRNTVRLIELINDLLDIEKLESGRLPMVFAQTKLSEIFDRAFDAVSANAESKSIDIDMKDLDISFTADPQRLVQVLVNLISNAIKFSPAKSTITVQAIAKQTDLEIHVIDQGRGIPSDKLEQVFQRFQQVEAEDAERGKGTGLGLPICKAIVESHNGKIGVESEVNKGSKFWIRIPLTQAVDSDAS